MPIFGHIGPEQMQLEMTQTPMDTGEKHQSQLLQESQEMFINCSVTEICDSRCGSKWHRLCSQGECLYFTAMLEEYDSKTELPFPNNMQQDNTGETWQLKNAKGSHSETKEFFQKLPERKRSSLWQIEFK